MRKIVISLILTMVWAASSVTGVGSAQDKESTIDAFMIKELERLNIPGASLAIVKGKNVEYTKGYGVSNPDGTKMTAKTPIVLGSVSKSFTALAIMQLVEQGKIRLQDPVQTYLPYFHTADREKSKRITIQHLLNHTSGLSTYDGQVGISQGNTTAKEHVKSLSDLELKHPVGERYEYSNLNYNILGAVIEEVTHQSYAEYVKEHIFTPLNMKHTYTDPSDAKKDHMATGYQAAFGFKYPTEQLNHKGTVASGYIISSAQDMAHYMIAQLNAGTFNGNRIISKDSMNALHHPSSFIGKNLHYAMGWEVSGDSISHNGWTENTYSKVLLDGEYGISLQINSMDYFNLNEYDTIISGVSKLIHDAEPPAPTPHPFTKYVVFDLIILAFLAHIGWTVYRWFKPKRQTTRRSLRILHGLFTILIDFLLPLVVLLGFPYLFGPLSTVTLFAPGIGHLLFILPLLLLLVGTIQWGKGLRALATEVKSG